MIEAVRCDSIADALDVLAVTRAISRCPMHGWFEELCVWIEDDHVCISLPVWLGWMVASAPSAGMTLDDLRQFGWRVCDRATLHELPVAAGTA